MKRRYASHNRVQRLQIPLPKDAWQGRIYHEADGHDLVVVCSGKMPSKDWPEGLTRAIAERALIHLPKGRA